MGREKGQRLLDGERKKKKEKEEKEEKTQKKE